MRGSVAFAAASPIWFLLLLVFPAIGLGVMGSLLFATAIAAFLAWAGLKWIAPAREARRRPTAHVEDPAAGRVRRFALGALGAVALLYLIFVLRAG